MRISVSAASAAPMATRKEEVDRKCSACEMEREEKNNLNISRKPSTMSSLEANDEIIDGIESIRSKGGSPLDGDTKEFMESRFGYDFSQVRIHTGATDARSAESMNSLAYTVENDIVFGKDQYQPNTLYGRRLLAHELTHVVQQSSISRSDSNMVSKDHLIQRQPTPPPPT